MTEVNKDLITMTSEWYYGVARLPLEVFSKLDTDYFISGTGEGLVFMCANPEERLHLEELGIDLGEGEDEVICDWYKLILDTGEVG